ncbi:helix-turn-helix transcriptional regulator [uncultured Adlercreutzia sp.]|uniref:helix-turn-helix transcriptional regulator n=1 Tax=uncultured Adlercreutzia sp. TaxID=875803 RepID=UPI0026750D73|nr:helix-turn-helix transcriptional regulator [uncultured Adlercreutzia sp.]
MTQTETGGASHREGVVSSTRYLDKRTALVVSTLWLALLRLWMMNFSDNPFFTPQTSDFFFAYWLGRGIAPLLLVVCLHALPLTQATLKRTIIPSAAAAAICGTIACSTWPTELSGIAVACAFLGFAGMGWMYVCWNEIYAPLRIYEVALSVMASLILSSVGAFLFAILPGIAQQGFTFVVPPLCAWATIRYIANPARTPINAAPFSVYPKDKMFSQVGSWFIMLALYAVVLGFVNQLPEEALFPLSPLLSYLVYNTISIVLAALFVLFVLGKRQLVSTKAFWSVLIASIGLSFILIIAYPEAAPVVVSVFSSIRYVAAGYINIKLVDISHHVRIPLYTLFAIGWGIIELGMILGTSIARIAIGYFDLGLDLVLISIMALLAMCLLLLSDNSRLSDYPLGTILRTASDNADERTQHVDNVSLELDDPDARLRAQCQRLIDQYGLTERETEIVFLIAQGFTQSYVAQSLLISHNTVRSHMKHIYTKLDIHSKNELLSILSQSPLDSSSH